MPKKISAATDFTGYTPISTAEELRELAYSNYGDKYYLTNDIDLYSYGYWESFDFKGTLDGNGHQIDNLTSTTGGLFASLYPGATVRNLKLTNINISVSGGSEGYGGIAGPIKITKNTTIKAIAVYGNFKNSDVVTYAYKVACAAPTANYKTGNRFSKSLNVKLATKEKGATIYYTINGSTPTTKSKKYTKAIKISKNTTLKVIVVANGKVKSNVSTYYYYRK